MTYNQIWKLLDDAGFITGAWTGYDIDDLPEEESNKFKDIIDLVRKLL